MPRKKLPTLRIQVANTALYCCPESRLNQLMHRFGMSIGVIKGNRFAERAVAANSRRRQFWPKHIPGPVVFSIAVQIDKRFNRYTPVEVHPAIAVDVQKRLAGF